MIYTHKYVFYKQIAYGQYTMYIGTSLIQLHNYNATKYIINGKYKLRGQLTLTTPDKFICYYGCTYMLR